MERYTGWIIASLITFAAGVGAVWAFYYTPPKQEIESPPCRSCSSVYAAAPAESQLTFCDLMEDPDRFAGRTIRVRAFVHHDAGYFALSDPACRNQNTFTRIIFDPSIQACGGVQKAFDDLLGHKHWCWKHLAGFDGTAGGVLVGRFERPDEPGYGRSGGWRFRFVVMCVEQAFSVYPDRWH